jgi:hypothetical protein
MTLVQGWWFGVPLHHKVAGKCDKNYASLEELSFYFQTCLSTWGQWYNHIFLALFTYLGRKFNGTINFVRNQLYFVAILSAKYIWNHSIGLGSLEQKKAEAFTDMSNNSATFSSEIFLRNKRQITKNDITA